MRYFSFALLSLPLILSACSQAPQQEITEVREPGELRRSAPPKLNTEQRLSPARQAMGSSEGAQDGGLGGITFHFDVPAGWKKEPLTPMRQVNLTMTDTPEAECYFTFLPGGGGGLTANLNRWRQQMGLGPLSEDAVAALPQKPIFGQPATYILIDGDYAGMGTDPKPDYRMLGLVLTYTDPNSQEDQAFFLKMVGPRSVIENEEAAFDTIATTLHAVAPGEEHNHDHGDGTAHSEDDGHDHGAEGHDHAAEGHDHAAEGHDHGAEGHDHAAHAAEEGAMKASAAAPSPTVDASNGFNGDLPEGWVEKEGSMMRQINLGIEGQEDVECYFTVLAGTGGGLEMNINRWRQQMGQPDLSSDEIANLPRQPLLGGEAHFVTIDGTFGGMRGNVQQTDFRMYGLARVDDSQAYFVKMTGPAGVLASQEDNFLAFSASIAPGAPSPAPAAAASKAANPHDMEDPTPAGGFNPGGLQWTAPEGWEDAGESMMRVVTYNIGEVECYITTLSGAAGGVDANINRWVGQMGQEPLDEAALAALPKISILATEAPMVDVSGNFKGMSGAEREAFKLLGTVVPKGDETIFVKMTGPEAEVDAQKDNFIAFCASIKS